MCLSEALCMGVVYGTRCVIMKRNDGVLSNDNSANPASLPIRFVGNPLKQLMLKECAESKYKFWWFEKLKLIIQVQVEKVFLYLSITYVVSTAHLILVSYEFDEI